MNAKRTTLLALLLLCLALPGCVRRKLTVTSNPPGALVYLNGEEFGRTPVTRDFTWYGTYDVTLRKEGYRTLKTRGKVIAPWWQWVPIDFFAELFPLTDRQTLAYRLESQTDRAESPDVMLDRAAAMEKQLKGTKYTQRKSPASTTRPTGE